MGMASGSIYVKMTSDTSGFWAFDGTSTGGFAVWGNRPRAKIPKELKALLTDPKAIFLNLGSIWVARTRPNGDRSEVYAIRVDELATVGVASSVETREIEYWASFHYRKDAYRVFPERDGWEEIFVGTPPKGVVRTAARDYVKRRMPTTISSMTGTTSYSNHW